jgi:serine/threonine-protein kinase
MAEQPPTTPSSPPSSLPFPPPTAPFPTDQEGAAEQHPTRAYIPPGASVLGGPGLDGDVAALPGGRYEIHGEIAHGGMGAILKGRDVFLARDLAVKVLLQRHQDHPEISRRFVEEAQIAGQLQHPGVVPVYDLGRLPDQRLFFTMKLVKGQTLAALLARRSDPSCDRPQLLKVFEQVCNTVAYAHARKVIHRDLKPQNVMVGAFGEVQVMDWGLAKVLTPPGTALEEPAAPAPSSAIRTVRTETADEGSQVGSVLGTYDYMPPEQARGAVHQLDERCDVFALGAMLCEILTGYPPYTGPTRDAVFAKAAHGDLAEAWVRLNDCGAEEELLRLARACLAADPRERPRDAGAVARDLSTYLASVQERLRAAELAATAARTKAAEERKARRLTLALAVSVLATVFLAGAGWLWIDRDRERRRAEQARQEAKRRAETSRQVEQALAEATQLRARARATPGDDPTPWAAALAAARRAEGRLAAAETGADPSLRRRVATLVADLEGEGRRRRQAARDRRMLARLEAINLRQTNTRGKYFDLALADRDYTRAFRAYGVNVLSLPAPKAAALLKARAIGGRLALELDHWSQVRRGAGGTGWQRLLRIARLTDPDPWRNALRRAQTRGDRQALLRLARTADLDRLPPMSLYLLGIGLSRLGEIPAGVKLLHQAQRRHPDDFWITYQLAYLLAVARPPRLDEAVRFFSAAVALRGQSAGVRLNLGNVLLDQGKIDQAVACYRDALRLHPDFFSAHYNLGIALRRKGDFDEARSAFRAALRLQPQSPEALCELGTVLHRLGQTDAAIRLLRRAQRLRPKYAQAHNNLGNAWRSKNDLDKAMREYRRAIALEPNFAEAHFNLGMTLDTRGQLDQAIVEYQRAVQCKKDFAGAYFNLGGALRDRGKLTEAAAALRQVIHLQPANPAARYQLGRILALQGRPADAAVQYREAIRLRSDHPRYHFDLGFALQNQGLFRAALAAFEQGRKVAKHLVWAKRGRDWAAACQRLIELDKNLPQILEGKRKPAGTDERLQLALLCLNYKQLPVAAARFYREAFADRPALVADWKKAYRHTAARAAARAAAGHGRDALLIDAKARAGWRKQALAWQTADLELIARDLQGGAAPARALARQALQQWQKDRDFTDLRGAEALALLPEVERKGWRKLWARVEKLLKQPAGPK